VKYYLLLLLAIAALVVIPLTRSEAQTSNTPTNLVATPGDGSVALTWIPATGSSYSEVFESPSASGPFTSISTVTDAPTGDSTTFSSVSNGLTYYFYVVPIGAGSQSTTVSATVTLPAPSSFTGISGDAEVTLNWSPSGGTGADFYNVYESSSAAGPFALIGNTNNQPNPTTYVQYGLTNNTTYYYGRRWYGGIELDSNRCARRFVLRYIPGNKFIGAVH